LAVSPEAEASNWTDGSFTCQACGRVIELREGVFYAVASRMHEAAEANEKHFGHMAQQENAKNVRRSRSRNHHTKLEMVTRALGLQPGAPAQSVLEFGTGTGAHAAEIMEAGHHYTGLDIAAPLLRRARTTYPVLEGGILAAADATQTPFQDNLFDGVFCTATLHHLPEPLDGVRELYRMLKPGGRFCFLEPKRFYPVHFYGYLKNPDVEIGTLKTTKRRVINCLKDLGASEINIDYCVYTPNKPKALTGVFDVVDAVCEKTGFH
jgi:ubiquinone/menaquinone biosynthesis C-methylase UbiE